MSESDSDSSSSEKLRLQKPDHPRIPDPAYIIFYFDRIGKLEKFSLNPSEAVINKINTEWKNLEDKSEWEAKNLAQKEKYAKEYAEYLPKACEVQAKILLAEFKKYPKPRQLGPHPPLTPLYFYIIENIATLVTDPEMTCLELTFAAEIEWAKVSDKTKYEEMAAKDQLRYQEEAAKFNELFFP